MSTIKAVIYPLAGLFQFYLAIQHGFPSGILFCICGMALIGLGILNLRKAVSPDAK